MSSNDFGTIIEIGDVLVSEDVVCEFFACDYPSCKGECCISGDSGAPLAEEELEGLEESYPAFRHLMTEEGRTSAEATGFFEIDREGDMVTPCCRVAETGGSGACAYCHFGPGGGTLCAIEMAGRLKPVSCALYPIRVTAFPGGGYALNLHRWKICAAAYEKGRREGVRVYQFLKEALIRRFGAEFYEALSAAAQHVIQSR